MLAPPLPSNEKERIQFLQELLILDTAPEDRFDILTTYCRSRFNVDIALISLVDQDRQWFKSRSGLDASETPREISFCGHTILNTDIMEVHDALKDERFADNPLVTGAPNIRFYAGAPLILAKGYCIGTLCIISKQPMRLAAEDKRHLQALAKTVTEEIEATTAIQ
ncbi:histidine kinase [Chromobacterium vaccinii]|uniref:GAF domain-containing protein n=1 Tax=Chromobacterium vaccinii TaxID=1108595 RepID=UPI000CE99466|nr:GAF domain-containing protein [Chromobacterium vaccinii]AVG16317.1 histidine kinase [Chromobacterium vaccinii]MBX9298993.1 GAF domain-containing protein [Chromobacterium vaccinii]MBX9355882.1 GAF domain-containing protein [Chromobacterium vaccinii]